MLYNRSVISETFAATFLGLEQFSPSLKNNLSVLLWWLLISNKCRRRWAWDFLSFLPHPIPYCTLTSTTSTGWDSSEATCVFCHHAAAPGAGPWGSAAARYWGLLLNFAFLHSCFMTRPSDASHSGRLLFPPRNHFQVTCLGHFPTALLTFARLLVIVRAQTWERRPVQSSESCEDYPCRQTLLGDRDGWVNGAVGGMFIFRWVCVPSPRGKMQRMVDWQGLIPNSAIWPKPSPASWPALECFSVWELLLTVSPQASPSLSQSLRPTQFPRGDNTRFP